MDSERKMKQQIFLIIHYHNFLNHSFYDFLVKYKKAWAENKSMPFFNIFVLLMLIKILLFFIVLPQINKNILFFDFFIYKLNKVCYNHIKETILL